MDAPNIHQRLAATMAEVAYIQKEKKTGMKYSIVSHDVVTAKVRPALLKNGIVYYPTELSHTTNGNRCEVALTVRFVNADNPEDFFDVPSLGFGIDTQDKGPGKAISYAVKYALLKALGLETGDDPDQENVEHISEAQMRNAEAAAKLEAEIDEKCALLKTCKDLDELKAMFTALRRDVKEHGKIITAKDARKAELSEGPANLLQGG